MYNLLVTFFSLFYFDQSFLYVMDALFIAYCIFLSVCKFFVKCCSVMQSISVFFRLTLAWLNAFSQNCSCRLTSAYKNPHTHCVSFDWNIDGIFSIVWR